MQWPTILIEVVTPQLKGFSFEVVLRVLVFAANFKLNIEAIFSMSQCAG